MPDHNLESARSDAAGARIRAPAPDIRFGNVDPLFVRCKSTAGEVGLQAMTALLLTGEIQKTDSSRGGG